PAERLQRTIPAPPERVYRAWLEPEIMHRWFAPAIFRVSKAEVDERVGGRFSVWHHDADGNDVGGFEATIEELVPHERIVLVGQFVGPDRSTDPALASRLTLTFTPAPNGGTLLHLTHKHLGGLRAHAPEIADNVRVGWESALDALATALDNTAK
ncbi:MAG: SRPBCC domain-containing protein, partial [Dehalococcoidia bacterium]